MGKRSRRKRSLLGRRDTRSRAEPGAAEPSEDPEVEGEAEIEADADPGPQPESEPDAASEPQLQPDDEPDAEVAPEPDDAPEPPKREPFVPPPHWPAPRFVSRRKMMRGHVRPPVDDPLLTERELHLVLGLTAMALGFVVVGLFGLIGLYLMLGAELFRALEEFFAVVLGAPG